MSRSARGDLVEVGLGLDNGTLGFARTTDQWLVVGAQLRDRVAGELAGLVADVEHIGSSAVVGLAAKPIVDLAAGLAAGLAIGDEFEPVRVSLEHHGWIYRGDAGGQGGYVFVLEARPGHRVAHLHVVEYRGRQWQDYLALRDLLRGDPEARARYEEVKRQLREAVGNDRVAYTDGKTAVVRALLSAPDGPGAAPVSVSPA